jgi:hypothetical protein
MAIDKKLIDQLLTDYQKSKDIYRGKRFAQRADQGRRCTGSKSRPLISSETDAVIEEVKQ